ncbi:MAG: conserved rane protein of unknown function [Hyphomicrobiales bacterium]|nr:conserved rane protein of unknown function [Hyphomicrobiales bacterium]
MFQRIAIAIGAGLASALLFVVPAKGTPVAFALAFLGSLPIMIAGLGFGPVVGLSAAFAGTLVIGLALHPLLALFFAGTLGLPAFWLSRLASQARTIPAEGAADAVKLDWFPLGRLLAWIATISAATALSVIVVLAARQGTLSATIDDVSSQFAPLVVRIFGSEDAIPGGFTAQQFARVIVLAMPAVMAGWTVVTLAVNLWLAARIAQISGLTASRTLDIPFNLRMPRDALWILGAGLAACFLGELPRLVGSTVAAAFGAAYALHGLAAVHAFLRGTPARLPMLIAIYFMMFVLLPWPLIMASAVGIFDTFIPLRRRPATATPITKP